MTGNRLGCEDKNECEWNPCGLGGSCFNIDKGRGWMCHCPQGFRCNNCSCDGDIVGSQIDPYLTFSVPAVAIIIACVAAQISKKRTPSELFQNRKACRHLALLPFNFLWISPLLFLWISPLLFFWIFIFFWNLFSPCSPSFPRKEGVQNLIHSKL